jgi:ankyrin repeat protein
LNALLNAGASVDAIDDNGLTALHYAAMKKNEEYARLLLEYGADVNSKTRNTQRTPVHCAVIHGRLPIVHLLSAYNADLAARDNYGKSIVHLAAEYWHHDILKFALHHGHSPFEQDDSGMSPIMYCAYMQNLKGVRLLMRCANSKQLLQQKNNDNMTALTLAKEAWAYDIVDFLESMEDKNNHETFLERVAQKTIRKIAHEQQSVKLLGYDKENKISMLTKSRNIFHLLRQREITSN